jgi:LL-diaminopimelate aminotransferase
MPRNSRFSEVAKSYLFQEIREKRRAFQEQYPDIKLISLSIGDTTEPLQPHTTSALVQAAHALGDKALYSGYGPEQGIQELREAISGTFYKGRISADDIFVSDGAKCDLGRLQLLFSENSKMALQDPAYPVYLDTSIIHRGKDSVVLLPCTPENNFFPDLKLAEKADVLFLCSPNNPTGTAWTHAELEKIVAFCKKQKKIVLFDVAYATYVQGDLPRSIYEIEGADKVAIEIGSFSKMAGFSGLRLGWSVVPTALKYPTGESVRQDWMRIITTFYNGASIASQKAGLAALSPTGFQELQKTIDFYLENAALLRKTFLELGYEVHGGIHSPYLWVRLKGKSSWETFDELLHGPHILTTPGVGFGTGGEGFLRISSFGNRDTIEEAIKRLRTKG